ncbi:MULTISPECIES: acyl-CoA dehydrogenase family protein [unclassified Hyphomonas]|jgi:(2S)-methylsuccinyl-CoA dehydrogenase|uniref:Methylsuccinyl-CoA dehydrogenase, predicted by (Erb et al, 2007) n=2 Tax=root TaxID=1 RepID=A0A160U2X5_9ZZZZ|nr:MULTISPECIES: acyl-CoA dehydrogenase family protein [unclassified Hyphomonas]MAN90516.1 acyl-CoA dehydrogenase [Hyphomonadaceae bacterium]MAA81541.1 acyl-CoA dehydrogenase [Hyphomonas sp.]MAL43906.1 acyl-CoA dehydrogenase [Hyphomonas sp.]MAX84296.1 acyl-CoA dehydrogenase [Hyphomonas sp.]HAO35583.1 acyl-CoA dehydrogenase [Hyphomonas sp.]|tara:strand:- start:2618 stop:4318 length:1701 start_codon:yes stop_codon:yes gene_type:complete
MDGAVEGPALNSAIIPNLVAVIKDASAAVDAYVDVARGKCREALTKADGRPDRAALERQQHMAHGLSWLGTYAETLRQTAEWAARLEQEGKFSTTEALLTQILFSEYCAQLIGGVPMNQGEVIRPHELGIVAEADALFATPVVQQLIIDGKTPAVMAAAAECLPDALSRNTVEETGLDETMSMVREQFSKYASDKIKPHAHEWHLNNEYIPMEVVNEMAELGVFGLTIPEEFGGFGMGKIAMCVVSEELSRGYIGTGSLGTRSEIAAELILIGGTDDQKTHWLPQIASGEILPTAVFTEPNTGSDLGSLRTRAVKSDDGSHYSVTGNKTWITHPVRADLMTLLARTDPATNNFSGLSMLLAEKPRGTDDAPFPADGMTGGEIEVLGYRGMKEYEIGFDDFKVKSENLLGGVEGQGFKHLMATFESARIQTAARAIGVAQNAFETGLQYALDRNQFGKQIFDFPRVSNKLVMMAAELVGVRQLTYFSARQKDGGKRCDLEAGMAKLLAARIAWAAADNALQIHGGNGFALEYPISRILQDARILNIFEGAGEVQAMVIARRLIESGN